MMPSKDAILERLDNLKEDTGEIKERLTDIEKHQREQNDKLMKHETTLYGEGSDKGLCGTVESNTRNIVKVILITVIISAGIGGGVSELVHLFGV